jgi:DivIVA domain-containing protein
MNEDDPEKRIAELERLHTEYRTGRTGHGGLTAADLRTVAFNKPPWGKRGYNEEEVDALVERIYAKLLNPSDPSLTAADIHNFAFSKPPFGQRGYSEDEVDALLDRVEAEIRRLEGRV